MFFAGNIKFLRKRKKKTQEDLALELGIKRPTLSGYENNIASPNIETLISFSNYFNISVDTLIKENISILSESMLYELEHGNDVFIKGSRLRILTKTVDKENNENIELVNEKAKAGYTRGFADLEYISKLPVFNLPFLSKEKSYRSFQITGDSMLPIPDGSWITAEYITDWNNIKDGNAYIVVTLNEGVVFKIIKKTQDSSQLELISLNPEYKPYNIKISEIKEIWEFCNFISSEIPVNNSDMDILSQNISEIKSNIEDLKNIINKKGE